jgi:transcription antitermination factor NusA-like protein
MKTNEIYNLVIVSKTTGTTLTSLLTSELPNTKEELIELAQKAIEMGYAAKVWALSEWEPLFEG